MKRKRAPDALMVFLGRLSVGGGRGGVFGRGMSPQNTSYVELEKKRNWCRDGVPVVTALLRCVYTVEMKATSHSGYTLTQDVF